MSVTTDFEQLKSKYSGFIEPVISLSIIPKSSRDNFIVTDLCVELTCGFSSNIATVSIYNVYDDNKKKFDDNKINQTFQIGKKIDIEVGYGKKTECVFSGFISGITYNFSQGQMPHITLECLDVRAVMMLNNNNTQILQDSYSACINNIIGRSEYKLYYKTAEVDGNIKSPKGEDRQLIEMVDESDYEFLVRVAKKLGYEFFVSQETLFFRKKREKKESIMEISDGNLIIDFEASYNIIGVANAVEVRNIDDRTGDVIKSEVCSSAVYSNSSAASKITKNAKRVIIDPTVLSIDEARDRALTELDNRAWRFGVFKIVTVGVPEYIPGRFIKINGLGQDINKKVYITKVRHEIDKRGYKTSLEAELNSL